MKEGLQLLLQFIRSKIDLPPEEEETFVRIVKEETFKRGEAFVQAGSIPTKIGFVVRGLFRYYYSNTSGDEYTKGFFQDSSFIVSYSALVSGTPSHFTIEALEESVILIFDYQKFKVLCKHHSCWNMLQLALLEIGYMKKEKREREFLLFNAEQRYTAFLKDYPGLEGRVSQKLIATYLGITPVALSRIRGTMER